MLWALQEDEDIVVLLTDKGNATILMDTLTYQEKTDVLLAVPSYKVVPKDPTGKVERRVVVLVKQAKLPNKVLKTLILLSARPCHLYGLSKIHKPNVLLRPIMSSMGHLHII